MIQLLPNQDGMLKASKENDKGVLQSPTGTGKTFAQAAIVADLLSQNRFSITLIKTPRIGLSNQLSVEYTKYITAIGLKFNSLLMHSGKGPELEPDRNLSLEEQLKAFEMVDNLPNATTSTQEMIAQIERSKELNEPYIVYTTYHSNQKVYEALEKAGYSIDLDINDEAHYLVREDFSKLLDTPRAIKQFFFTATLVVSESTDGRGMQNPERFGEVIYALSTRDALDMDLIVPVRSLHIKSALEFVDKDSFSNGIGQLVEEGFSSIEAEYGNIAPKMLVAVSGSKQIETLLSSKEFTRLIENDVNIITVHSVAEYTTHNGVQISRAEFDSLKDTLGEDVNAKLIIVHYDILSEGIDVPGLLGVLILRNMKEAKFLQTVGRVVRIYRKNPELKKHGLVLIPKVSQTLDMAENFKVMLTRLYEYGYMPSQLLHEYLAAGVEEDIDELDQLSPGTLNKISDTDLHLYTSSVDTPFLVADF
jgi:superfamily II DNA or RNA helicase